MNSDDIRSGIRHRDETAMRAGFQALVAPDDTIEGFNDGPDDAILLLRELADVLRRDPQPMPAPVAAAIRGQSEDDLNDSSFGAGAVAVMANLSRWKLILEQRFPAMITGE